MKVLAIRGKNLASLEDEFEIDFTAEPLKSAGIFAITGSTGAGKSTILDALCLALYDNAPRLKEAEKSVNINDVEDKTITQQDSRNILRRGATDGYAEVDFIALSGDKYRARWEVRRARGQAFGALQQTSIRLINLSETTEESGTKTELLKKITDIIGLNFNQFTRAVLLAQGEFANFLKAKQHDKAELLEKLTGTEVYSKISMLIFQKTGEAKNELFLVKGRIDDVKLLNDEELGLLNEEKNTLANSLKPLKESETLIEKQLDWILQEEKIKESVQNADNELAKVLQVIKQSIGRYQYIAMIDEAQQIRDVYNNWGEQQKQLLNTQNNLGTQQKELDKIIANIDNIGKELAQAKKNYDENENKFQKLKPDIEKAKLLDQKIQHEKERFEELQNEFKAQNSIKEKAETELKQLQQQIDDNKKVVETLNNWFAERESFREIVPRTEFLVNILNDAKFAKQQITEKEKSLTSSNQLIVTYTEKLKITEAELEKLNQLLPVEVINLRAKLVEGEPCPVCGSLHHSVENIVQSAEVNEKHLEEAKQKVNNEIADLKVKCDNTQKEITQLETLLENYRSQYNSSLEKVGDYFKNSADWKEKLETGEQQNKLIAFAKKWNESEEKLNTATNSLQSSEIKIESASNTFHNIQEEFARRQQLLQVADNSLKNLLKERQQLLNGENAANIETQYSKLREELLQILENKKEQKEKQEIAKSGLNGVITQIESSIETLQKETELLYDKIAAWANNSKHQITFEILNELMQKTPEWVTGEKQLLSALQEQEIAVTAKLKERQEQLTAHLQSENKPENGNGKETLTTQKTEVEEKLNTTNKRLTEIEVAITRQNENTKKINDLKKQIAEKEEKYNNWAKLNELLGSAKGQKFKTIAQGYTLDILLSYANKHLESLTRQYKLEKVPDSLALQIVDNYQLGEIRSIHTLSGGESFLISLSLALGLSSLSSNRMKIESLFIDEGFGSLDIDTLNIAMDALENLQTQGRKIGVISHVAEMNERIATKIKVIKYANNKSKIEIK